MRKNLLICAATMGLMGAGVANANIITFDDVAGTESWTTLINSQDFSFSANHLHSYGVGHGGWDETVWNGGTKLGYEGDADGGLRTGITMARQDGGAFSLLNLDVAEFFRNDQYSSRPNADYMTITGFFADNSTVEYQFSLDGISDGYLGLDDFQHLSLGTLFTNVTSILFAGFRLEGGPGGISIDNLEVANPVHVPEPATLGLMALSFGGLVYARRRRSAV